MQQSSLFRKSSMDRIQSPEQLNDYLHVTNPSIWVLFAAIVVLLVGLIVWAAFTYIGSYTSGTAQVKDSVMTIVFDDEATAKNVESGMYADVGENSSIITSVGRNTDGTIFALAETTLADGQYSVQVGYKMTQLLSLLFN